MHVQGFGFQGPGFSYRRQGWGVAGATSGVRGVGGRGRAGNWPTLYENGSDLTKSDDEFDYTACSSLAIFKKSCSKLRWQKF